jgi:FtsP/CotA-like multicopper oxidase with cupredoxin domain
VRWTNNQGFHNVNGSSADFPNNPESFTNGSAAPVGWTFEFTFNTPGTYDYHCDPHQDLGMVGTVIVEEASSVAEPAWASGLEIYPNPTSGELQINASINLEVIRLIDLTGRELQRSNVNAQQQRLNISNLPTGTYFLQLISGNEVVTRPVVKQ